MPDNRLCHEWVGNKCRHCGVVYGAAPSPEAPVVDAPKSMRCPRGGGSCSVDVCLEEGACTIHRVTDTAPAVDALTTGAVGEVKEKYPNIVWLDIYGRNLSDLVGAKLYFAHPASEPKALTDRYVQRYNEYSGEGGGVCENDEGEYVKYSDYIALLADRGSEQS